MKISRRTQRAKMAMSVVINVHGLPNIGRRIVTATFATSCWMLPVAMSCPTRRSWTLSLFLFLLLPVLTIQRSLDKRTLTPLSVKGITSLISSPDPIKSVDPSKPNSHLSKILIPRVCMYIPHTYNFSAHRLKPTPRTTLS